jgi:hypothetical protein
MMSLAIALSGAVEGSPHFTRIWLKFAISQITPLFVTFATLSHILVSSFIDILLFLES